MSGSLIARAVPSASEPLGPLAPPAQEMNIVHKNVQKSTSARNNTHKPALILEDFTVLQYPPHNILRNFCQYLCWSYCKDFLQTYSLLYQLSIQLYFNTPNNFVQYFEQHHSVNFHKFLREIMQTKFRFVCMLPEFFFHSCNKSGINVKF